MTKTSTRKHARHNGDHLHHDMEKIRKLILEAASDARGKAGEMVSDSYEDLKDKSARLQEDVANYAAEKPFKSLGTALLIGFALGYLLHKKNDQ